MTPEKLRALIAAGETLAVEFKGEERASLTDRQIIEAVVCLANRVGHEAAYLLIGVEDDGRVTGARPRHGAATDLARVAALHRLVEAGLVEEHGQKKGRTWHLSAATYRLLGDKAGYVRSRGFEPLQQEQMVLQYVDKHGRITRRETAELCRIGPFQATRLLDRLVKDGRLIRHGERKGAWYERGQKYERAHKPLVSAHIYEHCWAMQAEARRLDAAIAKNLEELGYGG